MSEPIHQEVTFDAPTSRVYDLLVDEERFSALTGATARIDPTEGGAFSLFGGQIEGRTIQLVPGQLIVQAWRVAGWPKGVYSIIRFELRADGARTVLDFDQDGFPADNRTSLDAGWHAMYWEPIRAHLAS